MDSDHDVELQCPFCGQLVMVKHHHSIGDLIYHKECENHSVLIKATVPPSVDRAYVLIKERRAQRR
jgi:DNA-directed RNA polymerase subunit RPC12/RpoP